MDASLLLQLIAGRISSLPYMNNADVNEDGNIDAEDALLILQFEAGFIPTLPPLHATGNEDVVLPFIQWLLNNLP